MKLPNRHKAIVTREKLLNYLLSKNHIIGRTKAKFFRNFGFDENNVQEFQNAIIKIAETNEIKETKASSFGTKYIIDGTVETPIGRKIQIRTVWIIESNTFVPRFVTAFPV
ncbi:hypothetical protein GF406_18110 [candidate division KSB1 bacterium]|nr:hypothetical protein [candidate division KSB1 bacterium]